MDAAAKSVEDTYGDYLTDLIYEKEDSFLEELDDLNIEVTFRDTLRASVQYAVLTRCGLDASPLSGRGRFTRHYEFQHHRHLSLPGYGHGR